MKCKACGSDDITQSKGKCNECLWVWEQEQKMIGHLSKKEQAKVREIAQHIKFENSIEFCERVDREKNK